MRIFANRLDKLKSVMSDLGMTEGFDVGMEMSGNPFAFRDMLSTMNNGGNIAFLGIPSKLGTFADNVRTFSCNIVSG